MTSPFDRTRNETDNWLMRYADPGGGDFTLTNQVLTGRDLEELMLWMDHIKSHMGLTATQWYLYADYEVDGTWSIDSDSDCWRKAFTPVVTLNSLQDLPITRVVGNYINNIAVVWDNTDSDVNLVGILQFITGDKDTLLSNPLAGTISEPDHVFEPSHQLSLDTLKTIDALEFDEQLNSLRMKIGLACLEPKRIKIYNVFSALYGGATGDNIVSDDNLLSDFQLRDEYGLPISSNAVALGSGINLGSDPTFLISHSDAIRRYSSNSIPIFHHYDVTGSLALSYDTENCFFEDGDNVITAVGDDLINFTADGESAGDTVEIKAGQWKVLYSGGSNDRKVAVFRASGTPLSGTKTISGVYTYTGAGTGNVSALATDDSKIEYIQSGVVRRATISTLHDTPTDIAVTIRDTVFDSDPPSYTDHTSFDDIAFSGISGASNLIGYLDGDTLFMDDGDDVERHEFSASVDKLIDWPYFAPTRIVANTQDALTCMQITEGTAQIVGFFRRSQNDQFQIQKSTDNEEAVTYQYWSSRYLVNYIPYDTEQFDTEYRVFAKLQIDTTEDEPDLTSQLIDAVIAFLYEDNIGGTVTCSLYTGDFPPADTEDQDDLEAAFNAIGDTIGSVVLPDRTSTYVTRAHVNFGPISPSDVQADGTLYLAFQISQYNQLVDLDLNQISLNALAFSLGGDKK